MTGMSPYRRSGRPAEDAPLAVPRRVEMGALWLFIHGAGLCAIVAACWGHLLATGALSAAWVFLLRRLGRLVKASTLARAQGEVARIEQASREELASALQAARDDAAREREEAARALAREREEHARCLHAVREEAVRDERARVQREAVQALREKAEREAEAAREAAAQAQARRDAVARADDELDARAAAGDPTTEDEAWALRQLREKQTAARLTEALDALRRWKVGGEADANLLKATVLARDRWRRAEAEEARAISIWQPLYHEGKARRARDSGQDKIAELTDELRKLEGTR